MDKLSMSLEDMIKAAPPKTGKGKGGGGKGSGGKGGAVKKVASTKAARAAAAPYGKKPKATLSSMYEEPAAKAAKPIVGLTTGTKVRVANLDFGVTQPDLKVRRVPPFPARPQTLAPSPSARRPPRPC